MKDLRLKKQRQMLLFTKLHLYILMQLMYICKRLPVGGGIGEQQVNNRVGKHQLPISLAVPACIGAQKHRAKVAGLQKNAHLPVGVTR